MDRNILVIWFILIQINSEELCHLHVSRKEWECISRVVYVGQNTY